MNKVMYENLPNEYSSLWLSFFLWKLAMKKSGWEKLNEYLKIVKLSKKRKKTATDRLIAVRETGVSWDQGGPIEGPPETPRTSQHYHIEEIKGIKEKEI